MYDREQAQLMELANASFDTYYQTETQLMAAGHNGPYEQPESPLRTTAHWLVILSKLAKADMSRDLQIERIQRLQNGIRAYHDPTLKNFVSRLNVTAEVDAVNGTIGAAWIFEGLSYSFHQVPDEGLLEICRGIYKNHCFSKRLGLWHRCFPDGSKGRLDQTFNHQLWMAYGSAALFHNDPEIMEDVKRFLAKISDNMGQYPDGLIYHPMPYKADFRSKASALVKSLRIVVDILREKPTRRLQDIKYERDMHLKSIGYHTFNMFALSGLRKLLPDDPFFKSKKFTAAAHYIAGRDYQKGLDMEDYFGYKYNLSGFESLSTMKELSDFYSAAEKEEISKVVAKQFALLDLESSKVLGPECFDVNTYAASCYKALV